MTDELNVIKVRPGRRDTQSSSWSGDWSIGGEVSRRVEPTRQCEPTVTTFGTVIERRRVRFGTSLECRVKVTATRVEHSKPDFDYLDHRNPKPFDMGRGDTFLIRPIDAIAREAQPRD